MASLQQELPERHLGFQCRNCTEVNFPGRRYSCGVCPEYNLCGDCFDANLVPEVPHHMYFHPMKVHYARAAFQLYFGGETNSIDNPSLQSYKCALCDVRGLTGGELFKHILKIHRSHPDYNEYSDLVFAFYQSEVVTPAALSKDEEKGLRERCAVVGTTQSRRRFCEDGLSLAQLLVHLKMLSLTAPEFPIRCVEILKQAHSLQAKQSGQDVVKTAEKYVSLIEHEVAAGLCERRLLLGRSSSVRLVRRIGTNGSAGTRTIATPSLIRRTLFLRRLNSVVGKEDSALPGVEELDKNRQGPLSSKLSKVSQDTEDQRVQNKASDKERFLCSRFLMNDKPTSRSRVAIKQQKANFIEALLCSMLADEELSPLPVKPFCLDGVNSLQMELPKKLAIVPWKPLAGEKILPMQQPYMNEMLRFYKALDEHKAKMDTLKRMSSTEADTTSAENLNILSNDQSSVMDAASNPNGNGDGSGVHGNENELASGVSPEPARSDSELLELTMARIIQDIDVIIAEEDDF